MLSLDINDRDNNITDTTQAGFSAFLIGNTGGNAATQTGGITRTIAGRQVTLSNTGTDAYDDRYRTVPTDGGTLTTHRLLRDFVFSRDQTGTSGLDVNITNLPPGQSCRVTVWSYDSGSPGNHISDWYANGVLVKDNYTFNGSNVPAVDAAVRFSFRHHHHRRGHAFVIGGRRDPASTTFGVYPQRRADRAARLCRTHPTNLSSAMRPLSSSCYSGLLLA